MTVDEPPISRDKSVIRHIIERHAAQRPDVVCANFADGTEWTWSAALRQLRRAAGALAAHGVGRGDRVLIMLPNGPEFLRAWWGTTALGAVMVPVHTAYRGDMLAHVCGDAGATLIVAAAEFAPLLDAIGVDLPRLDPDALAAGSEADLGAPVEPWDIATINYTSGTTGPAKGVVTPHLQTFWGGRDCFGAKAGLTVADRWMVDVPLFHVAAQQITVAAFSVGAGIAVRPLFDGRDYWGAIRTAGATIAVLVGTMGGFLRAQPPRETDRGHGLRVLIAAPILPDYQEFLERFGIEEMVTAFGSTETGSPLIGYGRDTLPAGTCGKPRRGIELRLVDQNDLEVPVGEVGELIMRTHQPWELNQGYHGQPEATAGAWRNGWFHTADLFRRDAHGWFYFVDRRKDSLRRRGENISSFQVEFAVAAHPAIAEAACVAHPDEYGEDEVKVFVVPEPGQPIDFAEVIEFVAARLAHYAVPRYFEVIEVLPKTTTQRVHKFKLRALGNSERTWDREAHGITVRRSGLLRG